MTIQYDEGKNQKNIRKHEISLLELATIYENPFISPTMNVLDVVYSVREKRYSDGQQLDNSKKL